MKTKPMRHISRHQKKNHLTIIIAGENENNLNIIVKNIKESIRKTQHVTSEGISYEIYTKINEV